MKAALERYVEGARWAKQVPAILRVRGAAALLVGLYGFPVRGWQSGNDVTR